MAIDNKKNIILFTAIVQYSLRNEVYLRFSNAVVPDRLISKPRTVKENPANTVFTVITAT